MKKGMTTLEKDNIKLDFSKNKICKKCSKEKPFSKFSHKKEKNGLWYFGCCYQCEYKRKLKNHGDSVQQYTKIQKHKENFTIEGRACMLRNRCKQRAKHYNLEFNLDKQFLINKLKNNICEQTGLQLIIDDSKYNPYAPSIDRINNFKGYTNDNIQITCMIYNFCKNKFTDKQVSDFFKKIKNS